MFKRMSWLLPVALCLGATECRFDDEDLGPEEDVTFATLEYADGEPVQGATSGVASKQLAVVRDINTFTDLWAEHAAGFAPQPAQPTVEFGTDMVIAAFAGERPTGGFRITVEEIRENDEFIVVEIETETPGDECVVTQAVTQPHHLVLLDDSDKPVQFSESTVEGPAC